MSTPQHECVDPIVDKIMEDYDFLFSPGLQTIGIDQLATRLARTLHAAVNGELHTELPLPASNNPQLPL